MSGTNPTGIEWPALDALPLPAALISGDGAVAAVNAALESVLGLSGDGLIGEDWARLLARTSDDTAMSAQGMVRRMALNGDHRWFRCTLTRLSDDASYAILIDVTAEQTLADLRAVNQMRDTLMHDAEIGTWRYDPDADLYYFSEHLALGHARDVKGVPTATLQLIQHKADTAKDLAIRARLTEQGGSAQSEMRYRGANGAWRHLHVHYHSGAQLASGRYEMFGLSQNITAQARARDDAKTAARRLKLALTAARAGVFEFDYATRKFWFSHEYLALVSRETLRASRGEPFGMFHPDDRETCRGLGGTLTPEAPAGSVEVRLLAPSGYRWVRVYFEIDRFQEGEPLHAVGLMLDIDAEKRMALELVEARQAAEAATSAKSDFLASVSHEIRTPMNGVVGILHLLKNEPLSVEAAGLLDEAIGCAGMLGQIINDVLDFSKMEAGKLDLAPTATDPAAILDSVAALIRPQVEAKGLYLRIKAAAGIGWLDIDPVRLRQCLFNTIGNAAKFTSEGGVEVRMSLTGDGEARRLRCEIQDTGIGIPDHAKSALFDRFKQAESGTTRKFGGTGLGLAISRSLARMMGGDMGFDSVLGQGSTFWFEIAAPPSDAPADAGAEIQASGGALDGLTILAVDDNRVNRLVAQKTLEAMGAAAVVADSGQAAIDAVAAQAFDLILMDVNMPDMDGLEATRRIRALGGAIAEIPVIAMTADVMSHHLERYRVAGMNGFVPKPFAPSQLLEEIMRLAGGEPEPAQALSA